MEIRLQCVSIDGSFLALHHRIKGFHVSRQLTVRREREILVGRNGLKQRLDLLRVYDLQVLRSSTLNQRSIQ